MKEVKANPGLASRAVTFGVCCGATALGMLAIGWITIQKLRFFEVR